MFLNRIKYLKFNFCIATKIIKNMFSNKKTMNYPIHFIFIYFEKVILLSKNKKTA